jgi:hypothetical protein
MRERVYLAGGQLEIAPADPGTILRARLPLAETAQPAASSDADQVAL